MAEFEIAKERIITVFGGSGFLGRHLVRALAQRGWRIRVATRRPDLAGHLQPLGRVGQIHAIQANLRYPASVEAALRGSEAVINLVGILVERGQQNFEAVHHFGARAVARAAKQHGIERFVQVSALGADADSSSIYARTKAKAEAAVLDSIPQAVIVRPSVLFGPEDDFFNRFAGMARIMPALPLIAGGATKLQPAYVGDVAEAVTRGIDGLAKPGTVYELGGPETKTLRELMAYVCQVTGRRRALVSLPGRLLHYPAMLSEIAFGLSLGALPSQFLLTRDQISLLEADNVVSAVAETDGRTFAGLGITPQAIETIVPSYLYRFRKTGQFGRGSLAA
jgi:uncharacterized protein YbjT (DUF2867 family)